MREKKTVRPNHVQTKTDIQSLTNFAPVAGMKGTCAKIAANPSQSAPSLLKMARRAGVIIARKCAGTETRAKLEIQK